MAVGYLVNTGVQVWVEFRRQDQRTDTQEILQGMRKALNIINEQTSPEAVENRQSQLDGLLFLVDCQNREAFEDYAEAVGTPVEIVGDQCPPN